MKKKLVAQATPIREDRSPQKKDIFVHHLSDKYLVSRIYEENLTLNNRKITQSKYKEFINISPKSIFKWPIST